MWNEQETTCTLSPRLKSRAAQAAVALVCLALSLYVMCVFLMGSDLGGQYKLSFRSMIAGTAQSPICYRVLLPQLVHAIITVLPSGVLQQLNQLGAAVRDSGFMTTLIHAYRPDMPPSLNDTDHLYESVIFVIVIWLCLLGYAAMLPVLARRLMPGVPAAQMLAPVIGLLVLPMPHRWFGYSYDYSMLLLMSLAMYAMAVRRWPLYYIVLTLAALNKETSIYIVFLYAVGFIGVHKPKTYMLHLVSQLALYAGLFYAVRLVPGGSMSTGLFSSTSTQLALLLQSYDYSFFISMLATFWLMTARWDEKPLLLKRWLWLAAPLFAAFLWLGYPHEYRQLLDIAPVATLMAAHTLARQLPSRSKIT